MLIISTHLPYIQAAVVVAELGLEGGILEDPSVRVFEEPPFSLLNALLVIAGVGPMQVLPTFPVFLICQYLFLSLGLG